MADEPNADDTSISAAGITTSSGDTGTAGGSPVVADPAAAPTVDVAVTAATNAPAPAVASPSDEPASAVPPAAVPEVTTAPVAPAVCEAVDPAAKIAAHGGIEALLLKLHEDVAFLRALFGWPEKNA